MKKIKPYIKKNIIFAYIFLLTIYTLSIIIFMSNSIEKADKKETLQVLTPICKKIKEPLMFKDFYRVERILNSLIGRWEGYIVRNRNGKIVVKNFSSENAHLVIENVLKKDKDFKFKHTNSGYDLFKCKVVDDENTLIGEVFILRKCYLKGKLLASVFTVKSITFILVLIILTPIVFNILFKKSLTNISSILNSFSTSFTSRRKSGECYQHIPLSLCEFLDNLEKSLSIVSEHKKKLEEELRLEEKELENVKNRLAKIEEELLIEKGKTSYEAKMSLISKAIIDIVEELKPTVSRISDETEKWLTGEKTSEEEKKKLFSVYKAISRITELLSQMEGVVKTVTFTKVELNLSELVVEVINEITKPEGYEIDFEVEEDVIVMGSYSRLREVIVELIRNARDALEKSRKKQIKVRVKKRKNLAIVTIEDSGPGFKEIDRVFDPFYTEKVSPFHKGLGLTIAKKIIIEHEGEIIVSNKKGGGARVEVFLPSK